MRAVSASSLPPFQRAAVFTAAALYPSSTSFASAASRSVSSVMYVLLIHSAVFDRVVSRWRSSFVLLTNTFAEAGSGAASAEAGAAPWEEEGAAREDDDAQERTRAALQSGKNRMAAETTRKATSSGPAGRSRG